MERLCAYPFFCHMRYSFAFLLNPMLPPRRLDSRGGFQPFFFSFFVESISPFRLALSQLGLPVFFPLVLLFPSPLSPLVRRSPRQHHSSPDRQQLACRNRPPPSFPPHWSGKTADRAPRPSQGIRIILVMPLATSSVLLTTFLYFFQ